MERDTSPTASTPMTFQPLTEADMCVPRGQVPFPLLDSELKDTNESTILGDSLEDISMTTHGDSNMELATVLEPTLMEGVEDNPVETPYVETPCVAKRTRSHDGEITIIPTPIEIYDDLIKKISNQN